MEWYEKAYRRNVIDMHIPDWNDKFMSEFDSKKYVELLVKSNVQSAVIYAHSHAGYAFYPTNVGAAHSALKGRNFLAEIFDGCKKNNIARVLYFSLIFDTWAYENNPDWRIVMHNGIEATFDKSKKSSRYGLCCPNSEGYIEYIRNYIAEFSELFDFEGVRFDMTFWPHICTCRHCRNKYYEQTGRSIPQVIDWYDEKWVNFARKREEWINEFAQMATSEVKKYNPEVTVEHQSSTFVGEWKQGINADFADSHDFLQGDFYGSPIEGSLVRKLFGNLSKNLPYGFETSFNISLLDHTAKKSKELLKCKAFACIADAGAFVFIDAIDPVGTINPEPYRIMSEILSETKKYEKYIGGERIADVAVYLGTESKFPYDKEPRMLITGSNSDNDHVSSLTGACRAMIANNILYTVITRKNINKLSSYKVLVLPDVMVLSIKEIEKIKEYVKKGGRVYASRYTSSMDCFGKTYDDNYGLSEIFGVKYKGKTDETFTYISPSEEFEKYFDSFNQKYPMGYTNRQTVNESISNDSKILGTLVLPFTNNNDGEKFASIHSDPPGKYTEYPAVIENKFGSGKCIYSGASLERYDVSSGVFNNLIKYLLEDSTIESNAPKCVEFTAFYLEDSDSLNISVLNFQNDLPNIPLFDIKVTFKLPYSRSVSRFMELPGEEDLEFNYNEENNKFDFIIDRLDTFKMYRIKLSK